MTLNGVMAVTLLYFTEFGKHAFQHITAPPAGPVSAVGICAELDSRHFAGTSPRPT